MTVRPEICVIAGCDRPHRARGLCKIHYDRERNDGRPRRDDTVLRTRARNRATKQLLEAHREEFNALFEAAVVEVAKEHKRLEAEAKKAGVTLTRTVRLRPGPRGEGQTIGERIKGREEW